MLKTHTTKGFCFHLEKSAVVDIVLAYIWYVTNVQIFSYACRRSSKQHLQTSLFSFSSIYVQPCIEWKLCSREIPSKQINTLEQKKHNCIWDSPFPPLHTTALESPTFATNKRSPTRTAVEAVEPASWFWLFSDFRNSESVWLYVSAARLQSGSRW